MKQRVGMVAVLVKQMVGMVAELVKQMVGMVGIVQKAQNLSKKEYKHFDRGQ